jgi:hypothetical protein
MYRYCKWGSHKRGPVCAMKCKPVYHMTCKVRGDTGCINTANGADIKEVLCAL